MRRKDVRQAAAIVLMLPLFCTAAPSATRGALPKPVRNSTKIGWRKHHWRDPYVAEWSNHQGARLIITASSIKFGEDKAAPYHDVTRVTNGREFQLEVTSDTKLNYLTRFMHVSFGDGDKTDQMKVTLYNSRKEMESGENSQGETVWYREK